MACPQSSWGSKNKDPIQVAELINFDDKNNQYRVEYTVQKLPEPKRHLLSAVALGSNGR
jgi:hypothetical protein